MPAILLLDSGPLGELCHSSPGIQGRVQAWQVQVLTNGDTVYVPEVADYELRRKLLHLISHSQAQPISLARLNQLAAVFDYLPVSTDMWRAAAQLWADARTQGTPTAPDAALDADMLLAAQARAVGGTVITTNTRHLSRFVQVIDWTTI
jgi:predicted nucleic acid-binding protein